MYSGIRPVCWQILVKTKVKIVVVGDNVKRWQKGREGGGKKKMERDKILIVMRTSSAATMMLPSANTQATPDWHSACEEASTFLQWHLYIRLYSTCVHQCKNTYLNARRFISFTICTEMLCSSSSWWIGTFVFIGYCGIPIANPSVEASIHCDSTKRAL